MTMTVQKSCKFAKVTATGMVTVPETWSVSKEVEMTVFQAVVVATKMTPALITALTLTPHLVWEIPSASNCTTMTIVGRIHATIQNFVPFITTTEATVTTTILIRRTA